MCAVAYDQPGEWLAPLFKVVELFEKGFRVYHHPVSDDTELAGIEDP